MEEKDPLKISGMHNGARPPLFKNAEKLRHSMTDAEKKLWEYLRIKPFGCKFRRQHPIKRYVLDFYCHKLRISIEVDGGDHLRKEQRKKDKIRTEYLHEIGITEYRFTNSQVLDEFEKTVDKLNSLIENGLKKHKK